MKLLSSFFEFIVEYESDEEYMFNRFEFILDGYQAMKVDRQSENKIVVTYQKNEKEE